MKKILIIFVLIFACNLSFSQIYLNSEDEAVAIALNNSRELYFSKIQAVENIRKSNLSFENFLPDFTFSFSEDDSIIQNREDSRSKRINFSVNQVLFDGGKSLYTYKENKISALYDYQNYLLSEKNFKEKVVNAFNAVYLQHKILEIKDELLDKALLQLKIIETEVNIGITLETDYLEYLVNLRKIENERKQLYFDLLQKERELKNLLGLDENVSVCILEQEDKSYDFFEIQSFVDVLFPLVKSENIELKKLELSLKSAENQSKISKKWLLPVLSLDAGAGFSGKSYPLTQPEYNVKLKFSFESNPFISSAYSSGIGFKDENISSVNNSVSGNVKIPTTIFSDIRLNRNSILQTKAKIEQTKQNLYEEFYSLVLSHDDAEIQKSFLQETLSIQQKRLSFMELQLANGEIKHVDYLDALSEIVELNISILTKKNEFLSVCRQLEIITGLNYGGIKNVCKI
ncbi:MAG: TolC family protein [Spirochaetaceae bacterium]|nr:TolC family protein [Spirochaetaceae bacterium]